MSTDILQLPRMLLISGQQQNVGKTTLACNIISRFSREYVVTAFKVSPHFHKNIGKAKILLQGEGFQILKETSTDSDKDTSRMLKAGADEAYLLQAEPESMKTGMHEMMQLVPSKNIIVCESAGVREHIKPGVFLALRQLYCKVCSVEDTTMFKIADRIVTFTTNGFDFSLDELKVKNGAWFLRNDRMIE
jgi:hypothetical protein